AAVGAGDAVAYHIAGEDRLQPLQFVEAGRGTKLRRLFSLGEKAGVLGAPEVDEAAHPFSAGMPAGRAERAEDIGLRRFRIGVERLGIVFPREGDDRVRREFLAAGDDAFAGRIKIEQFHAAAPPAARRRNMIEFSETRTVSPRWFSNSW